MKPVERTKLEHIASELLGSRGALSIYFPVLAERGYDGLEAMRLIAAYMALPREARIFSFELIDELEVATRIVIQRPPRA